MNCIPHELYLNKVVKNTIIEIKNSISMFNIRLDTDEESILKLKENQEKIYGLKHRKIFRKQCKNNKRCVECGLKFGHMSNWNPKWARNNIEKDDGWESSKTDINSQFKMY